MSNGEGGARAIPIFGPLFPKKVPGAIKQQRARQNIALRNLSDEELVSQIEEAVQSGISIQEQFPSTRGRTISIADLLEFDLRGRTLAERGFPLTSRLVRQLTDIPVPTPLETPIPPSDTSPPSVDPRRRFPPIGGLVREGFERAVPAAFRVLPLAGLFAQLFRRAPRFPSITVNVPRTLPAPGPRIPPQGGFGMGVVEASLSTLERLAPLGFGIAALASGRAMALAPGQSPFTQAELMTGQIDQPGVGLPFTDLRLRNPVTTDAAAMSALCMANLMSPWRPTCNGTSAAAKAYVTCNPATGKLVAFMPARFKIMPKTRRRRCRPR